MKKILLIIFLLPLIAFAQNKDLNFYRLSTENGLPEPQINALLQDNEGFIWMATQAGLVRYDGYSAKTYLNNFAYGSRSSYISTIYQDHEGVLWVGTIMKGIFRYNRATDSFKQFPFYPGRDSLNYISQILEDKSGNIWALTFTRLFTNGLVNCLNKKTGQWQSFGKMSKANHFIDATNFNALLEDHKGRIWLGSNNGLYEYDNAFKKFNGYFTSKDSAQQVDYHALYESPSEPGIIWMGAADIAKKSESVVIRFNAKDHSFTTYRDTAGIIKEDNKGNLWLGTDKGLALFDRQANCFINYYINEKKVQWYDNLIYQFQEDKAGNLWCASDFNGLFYFSTRSKTFTLYPANTNDPEALQSNQVLCFLVDSAGTTWMGTTSGLQWINQERSRFQVYKNEATTKDSYPGGAVNSFAEAADGSIWLATGKGLVHWNRITNSFKTVALINHSGSNSDINIQCVLVSKEGKVWCGSERYGLFSYDPATGRNKNYRKKKGDPTSFGADNINCIYEGHEGTIWIGTGGKGLNSINPVTGKFTQYPYINSNGYTPTENKLDDGGVLSIFEDRQGTLWIGTNWGGLNRFNRRYSYFTSYRDIPKGIFTVTNINEDKKGLLWLGTYLGGLFKFNPKTGDFQNFRQEDGLLYNGVYSKLQDKAGNLWISSPRGITVFNTDTHDIRHITKANGLPDIQTGYANSSLETRDGDFLMGTLNGFIEFNPGKFIPDSNPPVMHIETVSFKEAQAENNSLKDSTMLVFGHHQFDLRYDENRITIQYIGLHYQNAALTQYAYRLDGYDKDWIAAGTDRTAIYTNLSPGTYTFKVKAANSDGVWSKEVSFTIVIHPPWWETWWAYLIYALLLVTCVWGFINYRSGNLKRKNQLLEKKVSQRTNELQQSLENLKSTQKQLIQSEKMASLGELTAGIAHEIQNPLNFVNNFSEVNQEMIDEAAEEMNKENYDEVKNILNDIKDNEEKINHHGRRADAIVKNMLQHSRQTKGEKQPTDINALCDEYLRLAYHGMRAKDKSFNADYKTEFDENVGKINIIPQDIGRVLLNLINNAFYATNEKKKADDNAYVPTVTIVTKKLNDAIEIIVQDNGSGIPSSIKDKIFQPFFTTKPTGEGTGLGLSLSYDIIKAHGGELKVETLSAEAAAQAGKEGEGSTFTIQLPAT